MATMTMLKGAAIGLAIAAGMMAPNVASAYSATAYWTGRSEYVTTITYQSGVRCEYNYAGRTFWRTFTGAMCPSTVEVQ